MGLIDCPETSVSKHLTTRNNPEDGRIQFNRGGSLQSRIKVFFPCRFLAEDLQFSIIKYMDALGVPHDNQKDISTAIFAGHDG
jgi:hypothetical protein